MADLRMPQTNRITLAGRLGRDPELKFTAGNVAILTFSICNERKWKEKGGDVRTESFWMDCRVWRAFAEAMAVRLHKGSPVLVHGRIVCEEWQTKDGQPRKTFKLEAENIEILEWDEKPVNQEGPPRDKKPAAAQPDRDEEPNYDDLPF